MVRGRTRTIEVDMTVSNCGLPILPRGLLHGDTNLLIGVSLAKTRQFAAQDDVAWKRNSDTEEFIDNPNLSIERSYERLFGQNLCECS